MSSDDVNGALEAQSISHKLSELSRGAVPPDFE